MSGGFAAISCLPTGHQYWDCDDSDGNTTILTVDGLAICSHGLTLHITIVRAHGLCFRLIQYPSPSPKLFIEARTVTTSLWWLLVSGRYRYQV